MSDTDDHETLDLDSMFTEPPRPPTPPPTTSTYHRDEKYINPKDPQGDWTEIGIRLVGSHPLWAHHLWNASLALASYLDDVENRALYQDKCVLELGAGGALPSIVMWKNGSKKAVITDYPDNDLVDNMKFNIEHNRGSKDENEMDRVDVTGYIWGTSTKPLLETLPSPFTGFQLIILSDLIFNHSQHNALLKTCEEVLAPSPTAKQPCVLVFYTHHRPHLAHRDMQFFEIARERGWACEEIVTREFPPMFPDDSGEVSVRSTVHGWRLTR
ncbi:putative methyltransferase-domain-containing protein [Panaeolus papilionaceus]|nr:putative methyltransferase-domain-containing protein [Panaeolus papilionaceus]